VPGGIANGINDAGVVVGTVGTRAFVYSNGVVAAHYPYYMTPDQYPYYTITADAINNAGDIAGAYSYETSGCRDPYIGRDEPGQYGEGLCGADEAFAVNDSGWGTGTAGGYAFLSQQNAAMIPIGPINSTGWGINNTNQVVGSAPAGAFLYANGTYSYLNDLIDPSLGINLISAQDINNLGQIVANSSTDAYLLTPINNTSITPEPSSFVLMSLAVAAVVGSGKYRKRFGGSRNS
jgi:hypothetical protein